MHLVDTDLVIYEYDLHTDFPDAVIKQAEEAAAIPVASGSPECSEISGGCRDLRGWQIITIDGEDARDRDDAVSLKLTADGNYCLGVHIADVSRYVKEGSRLDREAFARGTSVYFPDRVLPMLPEILSNGVCSLNPGEDRYALSCLMTIDKRGRVVKHSLFPSVINSKAALSYDFVNKVLAGEAQSEFAVLLNNLNSLRSRLLKKRRKRGSVFFDFPEADIIMEETGEVAEVRKHLSGAGESIIEEAMIVANETVASLFRDRDLPFIYRIHELPEDDSILEMHDAVNALGYSLSKQRGSLKPYHIQKLLKKAECTRDYYLLQRLILLTLKHAAYATENCGHFGLASRCYCHFTSPIRRYPDLWVHRLIRYCFFKDDNKEENKDGKGKTGNLLKTLETAAEQSTVMECITEDAEREAAEYKKCRYLARYIGSEFDGFISGVVRGGFFVELDNTIEGMVSVSDLPKDEYKFHEHTRTLQGKTGGLCFHPGDKVRVKVEHVSVEDRRNYFVFVGFGE